MLLYLHGFNSSPQSKKAVQTQQWLQENAPQITFCCPQLPPYASRVMSILRPLVEAHLPQPVYLIGSSMGGFFATCLAEQYDLRAVLINPAVNPGNGLHNWLGENRNYATGEPWIFEPRHIEEYIDLQPVQIKRRDNYKLLLQTGDQVLDYRKAQHQYQGCYMITEEDGDHSFVDYQRHLRANHQFLVDALKTSTTELSSYSQ